MAIGPSNISTIFSLSLPLCSWVTVEYGGLCVCICVSVNVFLLTISEKSVRIKATSEVEFVQKCYSAPTQLHKCCCTLNPFIPIMLASNAC